VGITDADIGRHIRNGEMFFQNWEVMKTNFYSFTHPDFPTPNHHWGAGVLFYLIWKVGGLVGVHIFFTVLSLLAFFVFYLIAIKQSSIGISSLVSIVVMPLIAVRTEIRPEVFSYLFAGLFLWLLLDKQHIKVPF
jgi:predicted branched-subunit amino acid permease